MKNIQQITEQYNKLSSDNLKLQNQIKINTEEMLRLEGEARYIKGLEEPKKDKKK